MHGSHRVAREEGNVGAADPVQGEALVETHGVLEGDQVVHQALADLPWVRPRQSMPKVSAITLKRSGAAL